MSNIGRWAAPIVLLSRFLAITPAAAGADMDVERIRAEMLALADRLAANERDLAALRSAQQDLLRRLEAKSRADASGSIALPEQTAKEVPPASPTTNWLTDRVTVGGYGSLRFEANGGPGAVAGFTLRRLVFTTDARLTGRIRVYTETELERLHGIEVDKGASRSEGGLLLKQAVEGNSGAELALEQAWAQYDFAPGHGFRAGVILPPLGRFNLLHDDDYWDISRRTLVDRDAPVIPVKSAWRELGAGFVGAFNIGKSAKLDYQMYIMNGATIDFNLETAAQTRSSKRDKLELEGEFGLASGAFDGSQGARAVAWRTAYSPALSTEFALSGYHGRYTPDYLGVHEPVNSFGFDYKWRRGAFELEGEAIYSSFGRVRRVLDGFARTLVNSAAETYSSETRELESEIEFGIAGLSRTRYGVWTDLKYHWRPAWLKRTFLGKQFEDPRLLPVVRYERVWLNRSLQELRFRDGIITSLSFADVAQDRSSMGVSYRPIRNFGMQILYERNRRLKGSRLVFPRVDTSSTNGLVSGMVFSF